MCDIKNILGSLMRAQVHRGLKARVHLSPRLRPDTQQSWVDLGAVATLQQAQSGTLVTKEVPSIFMAGPAGGLGGPERGFTEDGSSHGAGPFLWRGLFALVDEEQLLPGKLCLQSLWKHPRDRREPTRLWSSSGQRERAAQAHRKADLSPNREEERERRPERDGRPRGNGGPGRMEARVGVGGPGGMGGPWEMEAYGGIYNQAKHF